MTLFGLIAAVIVLALVWWALTSILRAFGVGDPIATIVKVVFVLLVVFWLLSVVFGVGPGIRIR